MIEASGHAAADYNWIGYSGRARAGCGRVSHWRPERLTQDEPRPGRDLAATAEGNQIGEQDAVDRRRHSGPALQTADRSPGRRRSMPTHPTPTACRR